MKNLFIIILLLLSGSVHPADAQQTYRKKGSYTYVMKDTDTRLDAMEKAVERAKTEILIETFGTVVGVANYSTIENNSGSSSSKFLSISENEVEGEWVRTVGEPEFSFNCQNNLFYVTATITGDVRRITRAKTDVNVKILRNGISPKDETVEFLSGDQFFIDFKSPQSGYVVVYLYDHSGTVSRLLPSGNSDKASIEVKAGKEYILFDQKSPMHITPYDDLRNAQKVSGLYNLKCKKDDWELNRIYVIFSPNNFAKANDEGGSANHVAGLSFEDYTKWLGKARKQDLNMVVIEKDIKIQAKR